MDETIRKRAKIGKQFEIEVSQEDELPGYGWVAYFRFDAFDIEREKRRGKEVYKVTPKDLKNSTSYANRIITFVYRNETDAKDIRTYFIGIED
ncbi:MAG: hypothetical protein HZB68_04775 [Candidatus Aenigmarchaeota archaeon]|nr:hypothetical protein [Candidatus Aenigmarchaeota archaeon]